MNSMSKFLTTVRITIIFSAIFMIIGLIDAQRVFGDEDGTSSCEMDGTECSLYESPAFTTNPNKDGVVQTGEFTILPFPVNNLSYNWIVLLDLGSALPSCDINGTNCTWDNVKISDIIETHNFAHIDISSEAGLTHYR